jgi:succinyl-CoA synthetase beta subunit
MHPAAIARALADGALGSYKAGAPGPTPAVNKAMKIHEYQGKELLKKLRRADAARRRRVHGRRSRTRPAETLGGKVVVVKAQIHAGGRGKGGGVKVVKSAEEARQLDRDARDDAQDPPDRAPRARRSPAPHRGGRGIEKELYLGLVFDRATKAPGADGLEPKAAWTSRRWPTTPEKIIKVPIDPVVGLMPYQRSPRSTR